MSHQKTFTLHEAQRKLKEVLPLCQRLKKAFLEMEVVASMWEQNKTGPFAEIGLREQPVEPGYLANMVMSYKILRYLHEEGVLLRRVDPLLLDFPYVFDDHLVYLCWEEGEPEICYWHETDAGYAGRKPLYPGEEASQDSV